MLHCCRVAQVVWQGQPFRYGKPCGCPLREELEGGANGICRQVRPQAKVLNCWRAGCAVHKRSQCSPQQRASEEYSS